MGKRISNFDEDFIKNCNENSDKGYILEVDVEYPNHLHDSYNDLAILPERMENKKCQKLVCNLYTTDKILVHIRTLKRALSHRLIKFNNKI